MYAIGGLRVALHQPTMKSSPSYLTRAVFRAIAANRPYIVPGCQRQLHGVRTLRLPRKPLSYPQRRTLFSALLGSTSSKTFENARTTPKNLELALGRLVDLVRARRTNSRPPSDEDVLDAFKFIFNVHLEAQRRLTRNEIYLAMEAFKHFQEREMVRDNGPSPQLTRKDLHSVLSALALPSEREKFRTDMRSFATMVFAALPGSAQSIKATSEINIASEHVLPIYITVLARTGSATEAFELLRMANDQNVRIDVGKWIEVAKGLNAEGQTTKLGLWLEELEEMIDEFTADDYETLAIHFANTDQMIYAKRFYDYQMKAGVNVPTKELERLLEACIRNDQPEWGSSMAKQLEKRMEERGVMGTLLVWTASQTNDIQELRTDAGGLLGRISAAELDMQPFNRLLEYGLSKHRPEIQALSLEMADEREIRPNGKTYTLRLQYDLFRDDLAAAAATFDQMMREDMPSDHSDLSVINQLISKLAFSAEPDYETLMRAVDVLLERNADFDAEALAGLCRVFLLRDELEDATSMLRHRADMYPETDRARLSEVFRSFILDPTTSNQRAYNAYELFRHAFPETPVSLRLPIMQSFFSRSRSDLACQVFLHMRQREDGDARPDAEAYAACFIGIAECRDIDGLQQIYNALKLDQEVEPRTQVRNGLMLAYIACQMPYTAMIDHFWKILDSREGPSYSTFCIGLRACETWVPQGGHEARKIMAIVQAWNLEVTKELYDCYVGALAGMSEFESTVELIEEMERDIGVAPDAHTIGTFYNAIPWQYRKDEVEKWAKKAYPDLWDDLVAYGDEVDEEWEIRYFKIDRSIDITDEPLFEANVYDPLLSRQVVAALEPSSTAPPV